MPSAMIGTVATSKERQREANAMAKQLAQDAVAHAAELRDAAINASAFAWRITGADAGPLVKSGEDYGQRVSREEAACALADTFGWATLGDTARRIADAWTQAAKAWHAAEAQLRFAQTLAIAELHQQQALEERPLPPPQAALENGNAQRLQYPETFRVTTRPSHRSIRRSTPHNGSAPME